MQKTWLHVSHFTRVSRIAIILLHNLRVRIGRSTTLERTLWALGEVADTCYSAFYWEARLGSAQVWHALQGISQFFLHTQAFNPPAGPRFTEPGGMEGWVDLFGLVACIPGWFLCLKVVTNRARRWLTSLVRPTTLTTIPSQIKSNVTLIMVDKPQPSYSLLNVIK